MTEADREREAIVKWLRDLAERPQTSNVYRCAYSAIAMQIEYGRHLQETGNE